MADVVERLPFAISKRLSSTVEDVLSRNGRELHYTIAGVPFRLRVSPETPLTFETAPIQKDQQDSEPEAGEQTLAGWWLRNQASFHEGAGAVYAESRGEVKETFRFLESQNVDVWTPGSLKLLKRATAVSSSLNKSVAVIPDSAVFSVLAGQAGAVVKYNNLDSGTGTTSLYANGAVTFTHVVATETTWFAAGNNGSVYSGALSGGAPSVWTLTGADTTKPTRIAWAKHRLFAVNGNKIYWVDYSTPGATAALYSHPSASWQYTDIADVPGGVLFSGHGDGASHLQRVSLDTDGAAPTMTAATTTAILPSDEKALRISSLTGSLVCVLTDKGVRVAATQTSGELQYGPLFLERPSALLSTAKPALVSAGRFWWAAWGDSPVVYRIDSSVEVEQGVFAYAADMTSGVSPFTEISVRGDRPVVVTNGGALIYRHATELEPEGYLTSGRIRFRTEELKRFQYIDLSAAPLLGAITVDILNEADSETRLITHSIQGSGHLPTAEVPNEIGNLRFMSLKLTLDRSGTDPTDGPEVRGFQIKALPAMKPQRLYTLPLECYDRERWSTGAEDPYGYDGFARDRYLSLRAAEDAGGVVVLRDYKLGTPTAELCKLEGMKFIQMVQPDDGNLDGGMGGILMVTLRTLT